MTKQVTCEVSPAIVGTGLQWTMDVVFPPLVGDIMQGAPGAELEDYVVTAVVHRQLSGKAPVVVLRVRKVEKVQMGGGAVRKDAAKR